MEHAKHSIKPIGSRVFIGKLAGTRVFDPVGDEIGRVTDVIIVLRFTGLPTVVGLVVEVAGHRRVFVPVTRIVAIQPGQVITTGLVNIRQFQQRVAETMVMGELMDRVLAMRDGSGDVKIQDMCMEQDDRRDWYITKLYVQRVTSALALSRGETMLIDPSEVSHLRKSVLPQEATPLLAQLEDAKAADVADVLADLPEERRLEVAAQLGDDRLADVLEELGQEDRVSILTSLDVARAADILDVMQPDDATDLVNELPEKQAQILLAEMEPEEAADVRRLMAYGERTAGGLMTTTPVILPPDADVATLLAHVRRKDIPPALAAIVCVCRPPTETPTGRFLGAVHIQKALREPPQTLVGQILDDDLKGVDPSAGIGTVTRLLATYNLTAVPVVDKNRHLLGAVSVDDVLDHLLPEDWRDADEDETDLAMERERIEDGGQA